MHDKKNLTPLFFTPTATRLASHMHRATETHTATKTRARESTKILILATAAAHVPTSLLSRLGAADVIDAK